MMLKVEHTFFEHILPELLKAHLGKHVLIKGENVIAIFDNRNEAVKKGFEMFPHQAIYVKQIQETNESLKFFSIF